MHVINFLLCKFYFQDFCTLYVYTLWVLKIFVHFLKQHNRLDVFWWVRRINLLWCCVRKLLKMLQLVEIAKKKVNVAFYNFLVWNENLISTHFEDLCQLYTGCLQNHGTSGRMVIVHAKMDRKRRVTFFRSRLRFREKWIRRSDEFKWPYADCIISFQVSGYVRCTYYTKLKHIRCHKISKKDES